MLIGFALEYTGSLFFLFFFLLLLCVGNWHHGTYDGAGGSGRRTVCVLFGKIVEDKAQLGELVGGGEGWKQSRS